LALSWAIVALAVAVATPTRGQITTPLEHFGFNIGDDWHLATYTRYESYVRKLAEESPRMVLEEIGKTAEGRPHLMAIITSPENHRNLARYKEISRRLAMADDLTDEEARALAKEGKAVVWIDGGLHGTEIVGTHQLPVLIYEMVSRTDEETMRFLDDVILLAPHANPDGMEFVSSWYMRHDNPLDRTTSGLPRLYHWYVGHDNNRDAYMNAMPETENMSRILYREWFPQIMYNPHQSGPTGTILFAPPFRDPFNYNIDPLVIMGIQQVASEMRRRDPKDRRRPAGRWAPSRRGPLSAIRRLGATGAGPGHRTECARSAEGGSRHLYRRDVAHDRRRAGCGRQRPDACSKIRSGEWHDPAGHRPRHS
jgi:hypothetical protein